MSKAITGYVITDTQQSAFTKFILLFCDARVTADDRRNIQYVHDTEEGATAGLKALLASGSDDPGEFAFIQACSIWRVTLASEQLTHTAPDAG